MARYLLLILLGCLVCPKLEAQSSEEENRKAKPGSLTFTGLMTTRGLGIDAAYAVGNERRQFRFGLEVRQIRDDHEAHIDPVRPERGSRYIYGKLNSLTQINPTVGVEWNLVPLSRLNLFNVRVGLTAGPGIGLLNPYYLTVCLSSGGQACTPEIQAYDPDRHNFFNIQGRAPIGGGDFAPEVRLGGTLGGYALVDLSAREAYINGLVFGFRVDAFTERMPLVVETSMLQNQQVFLTASLGLVLGSRW